MADTLAMRSPAFTLSMLACLASLVLVAACSSTPSRPAYAQPQSSLPSCEETYGYPPCIYNGVSPYRGYEDFYPAYDYPFFPSTGVIVIPEPVPVPVPTPKPRPPRRPPPPRQPHPRQPPPCHPSPEHPCP